MQNRKTSSPRASVAGKAARNPISETSALPAPRAISLKQLRPYPRQAEFFGPCTKAQDADLDAVVASGHVEPIEVAPSTGLAFTILDGHRRVEAHRRAGKSEIMAIVRHDLEHATKDELDMVFLGFNQTRRHLDNIALAHIFVNACDAEVRRKSGRSRGAYAVEVIDKITAKLGMSRKNASRYYKLARTPLVIQNAVRRGDLKLVEGARLAELGEERLAEIAKALEQDDVSGARELAGLASRSRPVRAPQDVLRALASMLKEVRAKSGAWPAGELHAHRDALDAGVELLSSLVRRADRR